MSFKIQSRSRLKTSMHPIKNKYATDWYETLGYQVTSISWQLVGCRVKVLGKAEQLRRARGGPQTWLMTSVSSNQSIWPLLPQRLLSPLYGDSYNSGRYISQWGRILWPLGWCVGHFLPHACWFPSCHISHELYWLEKWRNYLRDLLNVLRLP